MLSTITGPASETLERRLMQRCHHLPTQEELSHHNCALGASRPWPGQQPWSRVIDSTADQDSRAERAVRLLKGGLSRSPTNKRAAEGAKEAV